MITLDRCNRLIDEGFSLLTVGNDKIPNFKWKNNQKEALNKWEFEQRFNSDTTKGVGIISGFDYLEVIDIDLKVFSTKKEKTDFWQEFYSFVNDNIFDFDKKFVVYQTKNEGFHILYKSKRVQGNTKIAKLKGHNEAVIESRGIGGYVFVYDRNVTEKTYKDIDFISDNDREILWEICRTYNFIDEKSPEEKSKPEIKTTGLTPWDEFNSKNSVLDLIKDDFDIVRSLSDKYVIRRHGAESPHSGYVYKDSGKMYLFSTGTIYPHETSLTPFAVYTYKNHNGDFSESAKKLYNDGFGDRVIKDFPKDIEMNIINEDLEFPLDIFPASFQKYILECNRTLNMSIDYMGCSLLWVASVILGNSFAIKVKNGWTEKAVLWISLVGQPGVGKTPSINMIDFPIDDINNKEIRQYKKLSEKYDHFQSLTKEEKSKTEHIDKPVKTQFIVNDITLEALVEIHEENKNSIGVMKDELAGWLKDMNKYRAGSDLEFWLSSWSGKSVNLNRKTSKSSFLERPFIPVIGGIQPNILNSIYTEEAKDNGFMDRMLVSFPDLLVDEYSDAEMSPDLMTWYSDKIKFFYSQIRNRLNFNSNGEIQPNIVKLSDEARKEWKRIFNEITYAQNSDTENEYMKSMLPKQKTYVPRFALIINSLFALDDDEKTDVLQVNKHSMLLAEKLSKYFIAMSKKVKFDSMESNDIKSVISAKSDKTNFDKFNAIYKRSEDINIKKISEILGVSRRTIYNWKTKIDEKEKQKKT